MAPYLVITITVTEAEFLALPGPDCATALRALLVERGLLLDQANHPVGVLQEAYDEMGARRLFRQTLPQRSTPCTGGCDDRGPGP